MKNQNRAQSGNPERCAAPEDRGPDQRGEQAIPIEPARIQSADQMRPVRRNSAVPALRRGLSYHKSIQKMKCHLCGSEFPLVTVCPKCGSRTFAAPGYGTQKLEEEVTRLFPQARVLRMDADTTSRKEAHQKLLEQFGRHEADILVGTQMIAKGLDFSAGHAGRHP